MASAASARFIERSACRSPLADAAPADMLPGSWEALQRADGTVVYWHPVHGIASMTPSRKRKPHPDSAAPDDAALEDWHVEERSRTISSPDTCEQLLAFLKRENVALPHGLSPRYRSQDTEMKQKLEELNTKQSTEAKHEYGAPPPERRGKVCGVCAAKLMAGCAGWGMGSPKWACFSCQVFICSWKCLNEHNKHGIGRPANTQNKIMSK